jgi:GT2 family glycosyltransferase
MMLVVIPVYLREPPDLGLTLTAVHSVHETASEPVNVVLIDDGSPAPALADELAGNAASVGFELYRSATNEGFSRSVNVGLRMALERGEDAMLVNADIEVLTASWDRIMRDQHDTEGRPAAVVGALLVYPGEELIQHAGVFFSLLTRIWDHRFRYAPATLPQALIPWSCPVTGAFQFIRHSTLEQVGVYDPEFRMAWEDVDYCLRVFAAGLECIYTPEVRAIHHESVFRGRADQKLTDWQQKGLARLTDKHRETNFARWVPELV